MPLEKVGDIASSDSSNSPPPAAALNVTSDLLAELFALCESHRVPVPELGRFWQHADGVPLRIFLWGPPGAGVEALATRLSGVRIAEAELREGVVEAGPRAELGWLYADGSWELEGPQRNAVRLLPGHLFAGVRVSAMVATGVRPGAPALDPEQWWPRVDLVVVMTPASAVLGNLETRQIEELRDAGCRAALLVTGLEGADDEDREDFRQEIERLKVEPLRKSFDSLQVWFTGDVVRDHELVEFLDQWVRQESPKGRREALQGALETCFESVSAVLERRRLDRDRLDEALLFLKGHGEDQVERLQDLVSQQRQGVESRVRAALQGVLEAPLPDRRQRPRRSSVRRPPGGQSETDAGASLWDALAELESTVLQLEDFEVWMRRRYRAEIDEFCAAYQERLPAFEFEWPSSQPAPGGVGSDSKPLALDDAALGDVALGDLRSEIESLLERVDESSSGDSGPGRRRGGRWRRWLGREQPTDERLSPEQVLRRYLEPRIESTLRRWADGTFRRVENAAHQVRQRFEEFLSRSLEENGGDEIAAAEKELATLSERWQEAGR